MDIYRLAVKKLFQTDNDVSILVLRVLLGVVFFPHGAQKLVGWFGGNGFSQTMAAFTHGGIPAALAFLVIMSESIGSVALITGLFTRIAASSPAVTMIVCALGNHVKNGFFMNWFGKQQGEGFEYHILAVAIALALTIRGGGRWSLDGSIVKRIQN
jgi:putative oxidoreductase